MVFSCPLSRKTLLIWMRCDNCCYFQNPVCFPWDETNRQKVRKEKGGREQGREGEKEGEKGRNNRTAQSAALPWCRLAHCREGWSQHHLISSLRTWPICTQVRFGQSFISVSGPRLMAVLKKMQLWLAKPNLLHRRQKKGEIGKEGIIYGSKRTQKGENDNRSPSLISRTSLEPGRMLMASAHSFTGLSLPRHLWSDNVRAFDFIPGSCKIWGSVVVKFVSFSPGHILNFSLFPFPFPFIKLYRWSVA